MTLEINDKKYVGTIFGFNYSMDFDTDEEFVDWLFTKLKTQYQSYPLLWEKIISTMLRQSDEYQAAKNKIQEFEARITALENA